MSAAPPDEYLVRKVLNSHLLVTILVTLSATLSIVINSIVAGRSLGADALAVFGLSTPILILISAVSGILANGGSFMCARHLNTGDTAAIRNNFSVTLIASIIVGAALTAVTVLLAPLMADLLGEGGDYESMAEDYIRCLGLSTIPMLLAQDLILYIRMDKGQALALVSIVVCVTVDAGFAYFGAESGMGMSAIGLAIGVSNLAAMAVCLPYFLRKERKVGLCRPENFGNELKGIVSAGLPTAINRGSQTLKNLVLNAFLLAFCGTVAVVSLSVQTSVYQFTIAICMGYGIMVATMCGMFYGERDKASIEATLRVSIRSGVLISTIVAIAIIIFADPIASLFLEGDGDLAAAATAIRLFILSLPTSSACLVFLYMYQTLGNLTMSNAISLTRGFGYVVLFSIAAYPLLGVNAVWISFVVADVLSVLTMMVIIRMKTGAFPHSLGDFILAPRGFDNVVEICSISIKNDMSEVMSLADRITGMCIQKGVDRERSEKVALCIEEMAGNVVRHAFKDDRDHFMDIRIILQDDDLIFRLRDDGIEFNPLEEDSEDHFGIRIVRTTAKSISYCSSSGLNNLTIVI